MRIAGRILKVDNDTIYMEQCFSRYIYKARKSACEVKGEEVVIPDFTDGTRISREEYSKLNAQ